MSKKEAQKRQDAAKKVLERARDAAGKVLDAADEAIRLNQELIDAMPEDAAKKARAATNGHAKKPEPAMAAAE